MRLYGRTAEGERVCVRAPYEPYFWVLAPPYAAEQLRELAAESMGRVASVVRIEAEQKRLFGKNVEALKVVAALPSDIPALRERVQKLGLDALESDILFSRRYLMDKKLIPMTLCEASGEYSAQENGKENAKEAVPVFEAESIQPLGHHTLESPRILAFDIETEKLAGEVPLKDNSILSIGLYGTGLQKVLIRKRFPTELDFVEFAEDEKGMLQRFTEIVRENQPDLLTGYYSDGFDLPSLKARAEQLGVPLALGLDGSPPRIRRDAEITGIPHLDMFKFVRLAAGRGMQTLSFDLNSVATELLNEGKESYLDSFRELSEENLEAFCKYNLNDARLTFLLCEKLLPSALEFVKLTGLPLHESTRMGFSQLVESYLMRNAADFQQLIPNRPSPGEIRKRSRGSFEGAYVYNPEPGLYKDIAVFDFRSLYPSIISAHNISPDTLNCECCYVSEDATWFCSKQRGFLSALVEEVIRRRAKVKQLLKVSGERFLQARQEALKTVANSLYGYLAFFGARWYSLGCARSIAAYGRHHIKKVIDEAKEAGFHVIYSDTDSIFLTLEGKSVEEARSFVDAVNAELPDLMELEYEGFYPYGMFVATKGTGHGAKKKYALLSESGALKIRGFETVRRNLSPVAKEVQSSVLRTLLTERNVEKAVAQVKDALAKLRGKEIPLDRVIIRTQIQKEIGDYEAIGPSVAAAQRMQALGMKAGPGSIVRYVIVQGREKLRERARLPEEVSEGSYDAEYYIQHQVIPAVEKILEVFGYDAHALLADQSKLSSFF